jgi:hypothetical protein
MSINDRVDRSEVWLTNDMQFLYQMASEFAAQDIARPSIL